jgi:uncharacterized protein with PIN domain
MIVVDSSAIVAILLDEPERARFRDIIASEAHCVISAVNVHESGCVLRSRLARFPLTWNHVSEKKSRQIKMLSMSLSQKSIQLLRDML